MEVVQEQAVDPFEPVSIDDPHDQLKHNDSKLAALKYVFNQYRAKARQIVQDAAEVAGWGLSVRTTSPSDLHNYTHICIANEDLISYNVPWHHYWVSLEYQPEAAKKLARLEQRSRDIMAEYSKCVDSRKTWLTKHLRPNHTNESVEELDMFEPIPVDQIKQEQHILSVLQLKLKYYYNIMLERFYDRLYSTQEMVDSGYISKNFKLYRIRANIYDTLEQRVHWYVLRSDTELIEWMDRMITRQSSIQALYSKTFLERKKEQK